MLKKLAVAVFSLGCLSTYAGEIRSSIISGCDQDKACAEMFECKALVLKPGTTVYVDKRGQISALTMDVSIEDGVRLCDMLNNNPEWEKTQEHQTLCGCFEAEYRSSNNLIKVYASQNDKAVVMFCLTNCFNSYMNSRNKMKKRLNQNRGNKTKQRWYNTQRYRRNHNNTDSESAGSQAAADSFDSSLRKRNPDYYPALKELKDSTSQAKNTKSAPKEKGLFSDLDGMINQMHESFGTRSLDMSNPNTEASCSDKVTRNNVDNENNKVQSSFYEESYRKVGDYEERKINDNGNIKTFVKQKGDREYRQVL